MSQKEDVTAMRGEARLVIGGDGVVRCEGLWTLPHLAGLEQQEAACPWPRATELVCDVSDITAMDTGGAWLLQRMVNRLEQEGRQVTIRGLSQKASELIEMVARSWAEGRPPEVTVAPVWLEQIGRHAWERGPQVWRSLAFLGEGLATLFFLTTHPRAIRWRSLLNNLQADGVRALPITGLLTFLMGVVIAYQGAEQLRTFGANIFIVDLVGISLLREIAPLVTAILLAGRSGSAYTAQIGTMKVTEELDALRALGISPMELLVVPKVLALVIALPLLTVYADATGVFGGMLIASSQLSVSFTEFVTRFEDAIALRHYLIGVGKAPVFAIIIALVGCYQGFQIRGGVDDVGRRTTISVVQGIFLVIVCDAFFSVLFRWWGW